MVEKIKKALEPFYCDRCTVYVKKPETRDGRTVFKETVLFRKVPCRLSGKAYLFGESAGRETSDSLKVNKTAKIFLPPEYVVEPGSRIEVERNGRSTVFGKSGSMSCYSSHNEVMAELLKDYA